MDFDLYVITQTTQTVAEVSKVCTGIQHQTLTWHAMALPRTTRQQVFSSTSFSSGAVDGQLF